MSMGHKSCDFASTDVTSSVKLEVYQSIKARCQLITFQYFCKIDQGHLSTFFPLTNFFCKDRHFKIQ